MRLRGFFPVALLLLGVTSAHAQQLGGRIRATFQTIDTGGNVLGNVLQDYRLTYRTPVTTSIYWEARLQALLNGFDQAGSAPADTAKFEPFFQLVYEGPRWEASGGFRFASITPKGDLSQAIDRERRDYFGRVGFGAEGLPRVDWSVNRTDIEESYTRTSTEDRSLLTTSYGRPIGHLGLGMENRWYTDHRTDYTRDFAEVTGNGDFRKEFRGARVTISGQAVASAGRTTEETPRAVTVEVKRLPREGLFAVDGTPLSDPLTSTPALIDGDPNTPAADFSGDFRNLGVNFGFSVSVDTIFVYLERSLQEGNEGDYAWNVYTSTEGVFWTLHISNALTFFDPLQRRFEIRFAAVTARYVKVVNTLYSLREPPIAVTEIEAYAEETRTGTEVAKQSHQSGNVAVTWLPARNVDVSLNSFASRQTNDTERRGFNEQADLNTTLSTSVRKGVTTTTVGLQAIDRSSTGSIPQDDRIASLTFALSPPGGVDFSVSGYRRRNTGYGDLLQSQDTVNVRAAARFIHDTEASLDLGWLDLEDAQAHLGTIRHSANLSVVSTLRPGLVFSASWLVERLDLQGVFVGPPRRTDYDVRSRLSYRPTRVLGASFEYLYQKIAGMSGTSRLWDVDWLPFPGGAIQVELSRRQDRRSLTGSFRDESRAGVRWTLNPRTVVDLSYMILKMGFPPFVIRQDVATAFVEYRF